MLHVNMEDNLRVVFVCDELLAGVAAKPPAGPTGGVIPPTGMFQIRSLWGRPPGGVCSSSPVPSRDVSYCALEVHILVPGS